MIKSIRLQNLLSHKETHIPFVPGINAIVGSSNNGKSAILCGFNWVFRNKPGGPTLISFWNRDKKGNPKEPTLASLELDDNVFITRYRGEFEEEAFNGYLVHKEGELYHKFDGGSGVPEKILSLLNISDVNVQQQHDPHFLLASTPGEVSRFFNKLIGMDLIDKLLSAADSRKRLYNQNLKIHTESEKEYQTELALLQWTDKAEVLLAKATKINIRIESNESQLSKLQGLIDSVHTTQETLETLEFIPLAEKFILKIDKLSGSIYEREKEYTQLSNLISEYKNHQTVINTIPDLGKPLELIKKIDGITEKIKNNEVELGKIQNLINSHKEYSKNIQEYTTEIEDLQKQLPQVCPLCGETRKEGCSIEH